VRNHDTENIQVCRDQMDSATGIAPAQFGSARQPLQHTAGDDHAIADHMPRIALDPHHSAAAILEGDLDGNPVMRHDHAFAYRIDIGKVGRRSRAGSFVAFHFQGSTTIHRNYLFIDLSAPVGNHTP